jgi:RNA methyltransferase, TrmH family
MVVITSPANPAVKAARKLARRHGRARAGDAFLVEGPQAIVEALPRLQRLFVTAETHARHAELIAAAHEHGADALTVTSEVLDDLASTVTPQGIVGVATLVEPDLSTLLADARLLVVLHQVRDPGNAGTALRNADAAGADGVIFTRGSVDPRNAKAVRASTGSVFHLPVVDDVAFGDLADACNAAGIRLLGLAGDGTADYTTADLAGRVALVFGNEAHGLPAAARDRCDAVLRVPLHDQPRPGYSGTAESLNLAATVAVVAFEAARQRSVSGMSGIRAPAPDAVEHSP